MKQIKYNHYTETIIYSIDMILQGLKKELRHRIDSLGIAVTGEQFVVLDTISRYKNIYQQKLSELLMKDKSNIMRILKILEEKKLISRTVSSVSNRLVYMLNVTDEGQRIINETIPKMKQFITEIFVNISDEEIEMLHSLSSKFQNDLSKIQASS